LDLANLGSRVRFIMHKVHSDYSWAAGDPNRPMGFREIQGTTFILGGFPPPTILTALESGIIISFQITGLQK
jgi:hypothetical protein